MRLGSTAILKKSKAHSIYKKQISERHDIVMR